MVHGSFIMIGIMSLDIHIIKCCLVGLGKQARVLGFENFTKCYFADTINSGSFRKRTMSMWSEIKMKFMRAFFL